jgi:prophage regulatory protein
MDEEDRFIGEAECARLSGLSRSTRWRAERKGMFPQRRVLTEGGRVGWLLSEVLAWSASRPTRSTATACADAAR